MFELLKTKAAIGGGHLFLFTTAKGLINTKLFATKTGMEAHHFASQVSGYIQEENTTAPL